MNSSSSISFTGWANRFSRLARLVSLLAFALVLASNRELRAQDAVRFTYVANQNAITITGYSGAGGAVTIPATINGLPVTAIGAEAFYGRTGLTRVTLPESLSTIGDAAFYGCAGSAQIDLPNSLTTIRDWAFSRCESLTQITFPASVTSIELSAFRDCPNLKLTRFLGNEPRIENSFTGFPTAASPFDCDVVVLYLPGATGWSNGFDCLGEDQAAPWLPAIGQPTTAGGPPDGSFEFPVDWAPNRQVTVEACADLAHPDWQPVGTVTLDATGTAQFSDPDSTLAPTRLYRLRTP